MILEVFCGVRTVAFLKNRNRLVTDLIVIDMDVGTFFATISHEYLVIHPPVSVVTDFIPCRRVNARIGWIVWISLTFPLESCQKTISIV